MNRRQLLKAAALLPVLTYAGQGQNSPTPSAGKIQIKPKRLTKGDTIGVIAPSSGVKPKAFDQAIQNLESLGFRTKIGRFARGGNGMFSGTDQERLHDLHWAFGEPEIRAVWCVRGGNGSQRILPDLDFALIGKNPKVFVGYSDITALHTAIHQNCGLVTFHGPLGTSTYSDYTTAHVLNAVTSSTAPRKIELSEFNKSQTSELYKTRVITGGKARGRLIGGNLTLLSSLVGTPGALANPRGRLLFLEAVDEQPWRVERMLTQLRQSIDLRELAGIAIGVLEGCVATEKNPTPPVFEVIQEQLGNLGIPVIYGLSFGHIRDQFTLPIGIEAELDTETATMTFLESAVV